MGGRGAEAEGGSRPDEGNGSEPSILSENTRRPQVAFASTASVMHQQEELVQGIVKRMTLGMNLSTEAY